MSSFLRGHGSRTYNTTASPSKAKNRLRSGYASAYGGPCNPEPSVKSALPRRTATALTQVLLFLRELHHLDAGQRLTRHDERGHHGGQDKAYLQDATPDLPCVSSL
jgi:hypothetical protein